MNGLIDQLIKIAIALALGALIGFEREWSRKPAGLRTHLLVSLAACLMTITSFSFEMPSRIVEGIIAGIGFLGAGTIIAAGKDIKGLTTAAGLWIVCMVGISVGTGRYALAAIVAVVAFLILRMREVMKKE
jgi:putative Mg2+ transporter-C (MgtC) family protein